MHGIWTEQGYLLRVEKGAALLEAITEFARQQGIRCASLIAIGAVDQVELGYFHAAEKRYDRRRFDGEWELLQLTGNLSQLDTEPMVHAHVMLGGPDYACVGGHLFAARVAVTTEVHLVPLDAEVRRKIDPELGVGLLNMPKL